VWRPGDDGVTELILVHRPRYDDWSLPKGKAHRGESDEDTALREVEEETGLRCRLGKELATVRYVTERGEDKTVRWWSMTVRKDVGFTPNDEVDQLRWVTLDEFDRVGSFESDRDVVHSFVTSRRRSGRS
jgi:8-oxo-dGTP pyrophosphatase MutT (NUDIX family)